MKIGISTLMIQRGQTGIAQYVFALVRGLMAFTPAHQFKLFVLQEDLPLFDFARQSVEIIPVPEKCRPPVSSILWHQSELPKLVQKLNLDVLHVPSYRRLLGRKPCALVATIHDLAPFLVARKYDWRRMFYGRVVVKYLARRQDEIIAISHNTARDIIRFFRLPASRLTVVHNGLDHQRFCPGDSAKAKAFVAERFGVAGNYFLYVARLEHPGKNHVRLIEAFNQFKQATGSPWKLLFGGSDWHGAEQIHAAIAASPYRADIKSLGFISDHELPAMYRAADIFVYPSLYEGFGLPPIEAMACGCPVISSSRGALAEIVGKAAIIINPEDVSEMALELRRVATDDAVRERLISNGKTQAALFDWNRTAAATFAVYQRALQRRLGLTKNELNYPGSKLIAALK